MRFWDASAIIPLCMQDPRTRLMEALSAQDSDLAVWWGTRTECVSALARLLRSGQLDVASEDRVRTVLRQLASSWIEIEPTEALRSAAERVLGVHPLRAADAFQLAAALDWCSGSPTGAGFVCLDARLREAARIEGFTVLPERLR